MTLEDKLKQIEDTVYGRNWRNLIATVRKAVEQRNQWMGEDEGKRYKFWQAQEDHELLAVLNDGDPF